jgi:hypothetical protein
MLEKVLEDVSRDPSAQKIRAFLSLVDSIPVAADKSTALAKYAEVVAAHNVLEALKALQCAFRIHARNEIVLDVAEGLLDSLGRKEAAAMVANYRSELLASKAPAVEFLASEVTKEFTFANKTMMAPKEIQDDTPALELDLTPSEPAAQSPSPPDEFHALEFTQGRASCVESVALSLSSEGVAALPSTVHVSPDAPALADADSAAPAVRLTFGEEISGKYSIFSDFLSDAGWDYRWLEWVEGFSDTALGLVHFVDYLRSQKKIEGVELEKAVVLLRRAVARHESDVRSKVRFFELFESERVKS